MPPIAARGRERAGEGEEGRREREEEETALQTA